LILVVVVVAVGSVPAVGSDYATQWLNYTMGSGMPFDPITYDDYDNPATALGRPMVDTTGDGWPTGTGSAAKAVAVVPVYQPFRYFEVVSIGQGGSLTLMFDHPVSDDPLNPCGIDFIVFGNTNLVINGTDRWRNGDPNLTGVGSSTTREPGRVSVSLDGVTWYTYANGPFADDCAPTLGRRYDPAHHEASLVGNLWWGAPTDPTYPLNPSLTAASFSGWTVAQVAMAYGYSAGGTGFDLAESGMSEIQYVRIDNPASSGVVSEIDAVADVAPRLVPDFDCDSDVDGDDLAVFDACATGPGMGPVPTGCARADLDRDGDVDQVDFGIVQRCFTGSGGLFDAACVD
jgi:hypothetical protein